MNYLKYFESFLFESNRAPLYHFTHSNKFFKIIDEDILKTNKPYLTHTDLPQQSISVTRNKLFSEKKFYKYRLELDTNKLLAAGFKPIPINEFNLSAKISLKTFGSETPDENIPTEQEEERIYKSIPNIGKYIINIDVDGSDVSQMIYHIEAYKNNLHLLETAYPWIKRIIDFLNKYPHINFRQLKKWKIDKDTPILNAKLIDEITKKK